MFSSGIKESLHFIQKNDTFPNRKFISNVKASETNYPLKGKILKVTRFESELAKSLTTSTAKKDFYAFFFEQKGLMAGLSLQGSKITKINPEPEGK